MNNDSSKKIYKNIKQVGTDGLELGTSLLSGLARPFQEKARRFIKEKAFERAKATIALSPKSIDDLSEEDIEAIVASEEAKLIQEIQEKGIYAALAALGLSVLG